MKQTVVSPTNSILPIPLVHSYFECAPLWKSLFFISTKKGYQDSSRKYKEKTVRVWFTRTHPLFDIGTAAVWSVFPGLAVTLKQHSWPAREKQLHGHSPVSNPCAVLAVTERELFQHRSNSALLNSEKKGAPTLARLDKALRNLVWRSGRGGWDELTFKVYSSPLTWLQYKIKRVHCLFSLALTWIA